MKNNFKNIVQLLIFSILIVSCDSSILDQEPRQSISLESAISTESNLRSLLLGIYDESGQVSTYGGRSQLISDLMGNTGELSWQGTFIQPRQFNNKSVLASNTFVAGNWNNNYEVINQANLIIDNISIFTDVAEKQKVEGEAKFLRAMAYFDLVRNFSKQYSGTSNADLGVPLRLTGITDFTQDLSKERNTVQEVYDQILSDLSDAYANLPSDNGIFADKYATKALEARVYLQQRDYPKARDAANDVIQNSGHSLLASGYSAVFNNDTDSSEDVFTFQVTDQTGSNGLITFYASQANGGRGGDIVVNDAFVNSFDSNLDERKAFFTLATGDRLTAKYTNQFGNVSVFRLAEMYLIRAECNFREGTNLGATPLSDVNLVRSRSNAPNLGALTLPLILKERTLELAFEGFALHDFKRTETNVGTLSWDDDKLVLPIPQSEMDSNSKIVQNPGYN